MRASIIVVCFIIACSVKSMNAQDTNENSLISFAEAEAISILNVNTKNISLRAIEIGGMPSLLGGCVWPTFPLGVNVDAYGKTIVEYKDWGPTGIGKNNESRLSIYPNPTSALLSIETTNPEPHSIQITSLKGQDIYSFKMEKSSMQIDLSALLKAVYLLTVGSNDFVGTEMMIKQ